MLFLLQPLAYVYQCNSQETCVFQANLVACLNACSKDTLCSHTGTYTTVEFAPLLMVYHSAVQWAYSGHHDSIAGLEGLASKKRTSGSESSFISTRHGRIVCSTT